MNKVNYDEELKNNNYISDIRLLQIYNDLKIENISFELFKSIIFGGETKATTVVDNLISYKSVICEYFNNKNESKSTIPQSSQEFINQRKSKAKTKAFYKGINNKKIKKWE